MKIRSIILIAFSGLIPLQLIAEETASSVISRMQARKTAREKGIENYMLTAKTAGILGTTYFERVSGTDSFRMVTPTEVTQKGLADGGFTPGMAKKATENMATGLNALGAGAQREFKLPDNNPIVGALKGAALGTFFMSQEMPSSGAFVYGIKEAELGAMDQKRDLKKFGDKATLVGTEKVNGKNAYLLRAENLNMSQTVYDDRKRLEGEFTLNTMSMWVDASESVPLKLRAEGISKSNGESHKVAIEKESLNYENRGGMLLPQKEIMRIVGVLTAEQEAEMKEARKELNMLKSQMPAGQKAMMMAMMGSQIEVLESMSKGKGIEVVTELYGVKVNGGRNAYLLALSKP